MSELDNLIFEEIRKLVLDPDYFDKLQEKESSRTDSDNKIKIIKKEIQKIDEQISRFLDLYGLGHFTIDQVSKKVEPLNAQKKDLECELNSLSSKTGILSKEETFEIAKSFDGVFEKGNLDEIRLVIESLIRFIELDNEDIYIHWKFA